MKRRKGLVLTALVLFGSLFIAFRSINGADSNEKIAQQQRLLNTVGMLLEQQHYSPKKINDEFSKKLADKNKQLETYSFTSIEKIQLKNRNEVVVNTCVEFINNTINDIYIKKFNKPHL